MEESLFFSKLIDQCSVLDLLKQLLMHSHHAIVITNADQQNGYPIVYANAVFCRHTGYELAELVGQSPSILQGPESNKRVIAKITPSLKKHGYFYGASINYRKDGSIYPVEWNISEIKNANGDTTHYISMQKDLTNMKRVAEQVKESNEVFKRFYQTCSNSSADIPIESEVIETLKSNEKLYNGNLRSDDNLELFEEAFFDFSPGEMGALGNKIKKSPVSAELFWLESPISDEDIESVTESIKELEAEIGLGEALNRAPNLQLIAKYMKEVANNLYFCVEFNDGALMIDEVANELCKIEDADSIPMEILATFCKDIAQWVEEVFVNKNAENIFNGENNTIAAGNQLLAFLK
jgi:PAS domain S-box-containing protein